METAADGVMLIDARGAVLMLNPACERLFQYPADEVIGQNVKMLMPEPYREEYDRYIDNFRRTGERKILGIGRESVGKQSRMTVRSSSRSFMISLERVERALRESTARLRAVVETAIDG
jgi:PAS domain S-box-containing protein